MASSQNEEMKIEVDYTDTIRAAKVTAQGINVESGALVITHGGSLPNAILEKVQIDEVVYTPFAFAGEHPFENFDARKLKPVVHGLNQAKDLVLQIDGLPRAVTPNFLMINNERYTKLNTYASASKKWREIVEFQDREEKATGQRPSVAQAGILFGHGPFPSDDTAGIEKLVGALTEAVKAAT